MCVYAIYCKHTPPPNHTCYQKIVLVCITCNRYTVYGGMYRGRSEISPRPTVQRHGNTAIRVYYPYNSLIVPFKTAYPDIFLFPRFNRNDTTPIFRQTPPMVAQCHRNAFVFGCLKNRPVGAICRKTSSEGSRPLGRSVLCCAVLYGLIIQHTYGKANTNTYLFTLLNTTRYCVWGGT